MADELSLFEQTLLGIIQGYAKGLWEISGAGSGAVMNAIGADMWRQNVLLGADNSSIEAAFEYVKNNAIAANIVEDIEVDISEDEIVVNVKGCRLHPITDYMEENNVPRSMGCPFGTSCSAAAEDATGEIYPIDSIESKDGNSKITLKKL